MGGVFFLLRVERQDNFPAVYYTEKVCLTSDEISLFSFPFFPFYPYNTEYPELWGMRQDKEVFIDVVVSEGLHV